MLQPDRSPRVFKCGSGVVAASAARHQKVLVQNAFPNIIDLLFYSPSLRTTELTTSRIDE